LVFCRGPLRLAPPIYRSISGFRLAAPASCDAFCRPGLPARSGLSDSVCSQLASPASGLLRHPKVTRPGTALLSVAFRRLSPVDRPLTSRIQRGDLRRRSLCCDLPAGVQFEASVTSRLFGQNRFQFRLRSRLRQRRSQLPAPPGRSLQPCIQLAPNTPPGQMRLSAFLRVTTQSFPLRTAVALYRRRIRFRHGPCTLSSARNRGLLPNPAVTASAVLQLSCSTVSSGFRLRSPDCGFGSSNRKSLTAFAAGSLRSFFVLELSAGLASEVALRLLPIRPAAGPRRRFSDLHLSASTFETQT